MCQCFLGDSSVSLYGAKIASRTEFLLFWLKQQPKVLTSDRCHACERGEGWVPLCVAYVASASARFNFRAKELAR